MTLEAADRSHLLGLARRSIERGLESPLAPAPLPAEALAPGLAAPAASFVTLKRGGRLRGCRGMIEPVRPLAEDVWHNAWASAFDDPRFPPLHATELDDLRVAISVLSALERVGAASESELLGQLQPGRHGLVLALGPRRATFLPQVWESLPEPGLFLDELKAKAGLPRDFWSPDIEAWRYGTETLSED